MGRFSVFYQFDNFISIYFYRYFLRFYIFTTFINLTNYNEVVLEVKFDRFLESYIGKVLMENINSQESISKYIMGRNV